MYFMFKYKNMMPSDFNKLSSEEKILLNVFINTELDERIEHASKSEAMSVIAL
nr:hypothetical protein [Paeniclostridium ghonii]MCM0167002.1 hypothetical protein [Paeniclostridium ghonii]